MFLAQLQAKPDQSSQPRDGFGLAQGLEKPKPGHQATAFEEFSAQILVIIRSENQSNLPSSPSFVYITLYSAEIHCSDKPVGFGCMIITSE
jgi:hypothetical protein